MTEQAIAGDTNILLESGTNELEIVEFSVDGNIYGINVAKVREIIKFPDNIVPVPDSHPSYEGMANIRGQVISIINLPKHLGAPGDIDRESSFIIISEFNMTMIGFCVHSVSRIHRLSWKQIEAPSGMLSNQEGVVAAIVKFDDRMILLLDFEKITADINPETGMNETSASQTKNEAIGLDRSTKTILIAEDSSYIMKIMVKKLQDAGYNVRTALNGQIAWDLLLSIVNAENYRSMSDHVNILISDIEMPQMDGLHLIKNVKSHNEMESLPCIVFSSMINSEMSSKCKFVGADAQLSKPDLGELVQIVDNIAASPPD
jgi:two-component system chemotaxis response regulator CheV